MTDIIDRANDTAQDDLERTLAKAPRFEQPSLTECLDCGDDIPIQRQKIGGVTRCIDCQERIERQKMVRRW